MPSYTTTPPSGAAASPNDYTAPPPGHAASRGRNGRDARTKEITRLPVGALLTLAAAGFVVMMAEMIPVGLLSYIAEDYGFETVEKAGRMVSVYGLGTAAAAVPLAAATRRLPRKPLLLTLMAIFFATTVVTALHPAYFIVLTARLLAGVSAGVVWAMLAGYAVSISPEKSQGRGMAIAMGGTPMALAFGIPLGSAIGKYASWPAAFWAMAIGTGVLALLMMFLLPDVPGEPRVARRSVWQVAALPGMRTVIAVTVLYSLGHNIAYIYLAEIAAISGQEKIVFTMQLVFGVSAAAGLTYIGKHVDTKLGLLIRQTSGLLAFVLALLALVSQSPVMVFVALVLWGLSFGGTPNLVQMGSAFNAGPSRDVGQAMIVTAWNASVALAGFLGGMLTDSFNVVIVLVVGSGFAVGAFVLAHQNRSAFRTAAERAADQPKKEELSQVTPQERYSAAPTAPYDPANTVAAQQGYAYAEALATGQYPQQGYGYDAYTGQPYGHDPYGQPQHGGLPAQQYSEPQYGHDPYGQPQYGQPQYGQPQYGQPQYGQPQYGQPQYGQPQYGQPEYSQDPYAGQQYGHSPYEGQHYAQGPNAQDPYAQDPYTQQGQYAPQPQGGYGEGAGAPFDPSLLPPISGSIPYAPAAEYGDAGQYAHAAPHEGAPVHQPATPHEDFAASTNQQHGPTTGEIFGSEPSAEDILLLGLNATTPLPQGDLTAHGENHDTTHAASAGDVQFDRRSRRPRLPVAGTVGASELLDDDEGTWDSDDDFDLVGRDDQPGTGRMGSVPANRMQTPDLGTLTPGQLTQLEETMSSKVVAQQGAVATICAALRKSAARQKPQAPLSSLLVSGPAGVGRDSMYRALAEVLYGREDAVVHVAVANLAGQNLREALLGSATRPGLLSKHLSSRGDAVIVLDDPANGPSDTAHVVRELITTGALAHPSGGHLDVRRCVIILSQQDGGLRWFEAGPAVPRGASRALAQVAQYLGVEVAQSLDDVAMVHPLDPQALYEVAVRRCGAIVRELAGHGQKVEVTKAAQRLIVAAALSQRPEGLGGFLDSVTGVVRGPLEAAVQAAPQDKRALRIDMVVGKAQLYVTRVSS